MAPPDPKPCIGACCSCGAGGAGGGGTSGSGTAGTKLSGGPAPSASASSSSPSAGGCPCCNGSPCQVATGNYIIANTDLSISTASFAIGSSRSYQSQSGQDGHLGVGWTSNFAARLYYATYLYAAPSTWLKEAYVLLPSGGRLRFTENTDGTFSAMYSRTENLVKNGDGTFKLTSSDGDLIHHFASNGTLTSVADRYGNAIGYTYDGNGRIQRVSDMAGSGRYLDVFFNSGGRISHVQDNSARIVRYDYNPDGTLSFVTNAKGLRTNYSYVPDRFPMLSRITDHWDRVITDLTYYPGGRLMYYTEEGERYGYDYNFANNPYGGRYKGDTDGLSWELSYNAEGFVTQRKMYRIGGTDPASFLTNTDFYPSGLLQMSTDEVGVKAFHTYDTAGKVTSVTRDYQGASAVRFDYEYDTSFPDKVKSVIPKNPTTSVFDPNWQGWRYDYHPVGSPAPGSLQRVYRIRNDGTTLDTQTTYTYDNKGRVITTADAAGNATDYTYDAQGNLWKVTAPSNNDGGTRSVTAYAYDNLGRLASATDPLGKVSVYTYDELDRIATATLPKPVAGSPLNFVTTYTRDVWDAVSGLLFTNVTDPNSRITKQGYDQFGRLVKSVDALNNTTSYGYTRKLLTSITDANDNVTSYEYDDFKRLKATVFPDGMRETYTYSSDGLLASKTDRKLQTITYNYDRHKRLTRKTYPNSTYIDYTYQGQKLTQVYDNFNSPAETHTFSYDPSYRVSSNTQGPRGTIGYTYAPTDAVASYTVTGGPTTSYTYYPDGSMNTITWSLIAGNFKYRYTLAGQYQTVTFPNGQTRNYNYDDQGRLLQLSNLHPSTGNLATNAYGYDMNHYTGTNTMLGQRVSMTATVPAQGFNNHLTKYYYDSNYQLTRADYPNVAPFNGEIHQWTYDAIGNRLTNQVNASIQNYTYQRIGANPKNWQRLLNDGVNSYTYDNNGSTATKTGLAFGWDTESHMASVSVPATSYRYDYRGRRTTKASGAATVYLHDNSSWNTISEASTSTVHYLFGPALDEILVSAASGQIRFYASDGLTSVTNVRDNAGSLLADAVYDAWGTIRGGSGNVPLGYTGREQSEAGLAFHRSRYYDSSVGRFNSEDRLRFADYNMYAYVQNNPVIFTDPLGLFPHTPGGPDHPPGALRLRAGRVV